MHTVPTCLLTVLLSCCLVAADEPVTLPHVWVSQGFTPAETDSLAIEQRSDGTFVVFATAKTGNRIDVLDAATGKHLKSLGREGRGAGEFRRPNSVATTRFSVSKNGSGEKDVARVLFVVERDNARLQAFDVDSLHPLGVFGEGTLAKPYGIAVLDRGDSKQLFITDVEGPSTRRVHVFDVAHRNGGLSVRHVRSFGDERGAGAILEPESIAVDERRGRLLICDEEQTQKCVKVYTTDGRFTGETFARGLVKGDPEGIIVIEQDADRFIVLTDQQPDKSIWHVFDAESYAHRGAFTGTPTIANTDGICFTTRGFGPFERGAFFAVHDDAEVRAFDLGRILTAVRSAAK